MSANGRKSLAQRRAVQMLLILTLLAYPLLQGLTNFAASAARTIPTLNGAEYPMANTSPFGQNYQPADIKVLAEGFHSKITKPFIAVVRDTETYAALIKLDENLPKLDADFFKENVAIAAFLGERNTGGYSVKISSVLGGYKIAERKPGKGMMVPQMITAPFTMVSIPTNGDERALIELDDAWKAALHHYRLTSGRFRMSGGFAGLAKEFGLEGRVSVIGAGKVATFFFAISEAGSEHGLARGLRGSATGIVEEDTKITIRKLSWTSLVDLPNAGLHASGFFGDGGKTLSLMLTSLPSRIADGYSGEGSIEATMTDPPR